MSITKRFERRVGMWRRFMLQTYRAEHGNHPLVEAYFDDLRLLIGPDIERCG